MVKFTIDNPHAASGCASSTRAHDAMLLARSRLPRNSAALWEEMCGIRNARQQFVANHSRQFQTR